MSTWKPMVDIFRTYLFKIVGYENFILRISFGTLLYLSRGFNLTSVEYGSRDTFDHLGTLRC